MAKKTKKAWLPPESKSMRFLKILNIEFHEPNLSDQIFDVNILEEIETGEILLYIYKKGERIPIGFTLCDKGISITEIHYEIRNNLRAWSGKKQKVYKIIQSEEIDVQFPKIREGQDDRIKREDEKLRNVPVKNRVDHSNDTADIVEAQEKKAKKKKVTKKKEPIEPIEPMKGSKTTGSTKQPPKKKNVTPPPSTKKKTTKKKVQPLTEGNEKRNSKKNAPSKKSTPKPPGPKKKITRKKKTTNKTSSKKELF